MNLKINEQSAQIKKVPAEIFSRVSGYFRPTFTWNAAKQQEFKERRYLNYARTGNETRL